MNRKRIIIIGGGFAGINLLRQLAGDDRFEVTLVDRNNYNFFPPLLYQVATGYLEVSNIAYPFRKLMRNMTNCHFRQGELQRFEPLQNQVYLSTGTIKYDYIVFATGASTNYFGMDNVRKAALPMKSVHDALELRNHILQQLELATVTTDPEEKLKYLNIVVAGGGPTGIEISGMLADLRRYILYKDYPELNDKNSGANIYVVDGVDALLKPMSKKSQQEAFNALQNRGVKILLGKQVKDYADDAVLFTDGSSIATKTLIWAAGVGCPAYAGIPDECYGRGKRLITDEFNQVKGLENVFAIGDASIQISASYPNGHPQLAQVAIQQGGNLGRNLKAMTGQQQLQPFSYRDKGTMAIIGRNQAVVDLPGNKVHFKGFLAWLMWLFVHLLSLISARNKMTTFYNWAGAYFSKDQPLRMIIRPGHVQQD